MTEFISSLFSLFGFPVLHLQCIACFAASKSKMALDKEVKMEVENPSTHQTEEENQVDPFTLESILEYALK